MSNITTIKQSGDASIEALRKAAFPDGLHCDICMTPIEHWEPLDTYIGQCCELFSDFVDLIDEFENNHDRYLKNDFYKAFLKTVAIEYPDIPDTAATFAELVAIQIDCGVITKMLGNVA